MIEKEQSSSSWSHPSELRRSMTHGDLNGHLITFQILIPSSISWGATHEAILQPSSEAHNSF